MRQVWEQSTATGSERLLLLMIASYAKDDGYAWPGIEALADRMNASTRTVIRLTKQLEDKGELFVDHSRGRGNRYIVRIGLTDEEFAVALQGRLNYSEKEISDILKCDKSGGLTDTDGTLNVTHMSKESSRIIKESSLVAGADAEDASAQSDSDSDYARIFGEEPKRMPRAAPRSEQEIIDGNKQASMAYLQRLRDEPWLHWGEESDEAQKQFRRHNGTAPVIKRLGYELEQRFGLRPLWTNRKDIKAWFSGLSNCLSVTENDYELVLEAATQLREKELEMSTPFSLVKMARSLAAKRESERRPKVITISQ